MSEEKGPPTAAVPGDSAPAQIFTGYNTFTGGGRTGAVTGQSVSVDGEARTYYKVCRDFTSLTEALNISASVKGSAEIGSVSAKLKFAKSLELTSRSITILVYTNIITSSLKQTEVHLKDAAPKDLRDFCAAYGDSYVSAMTSGAEYIAAYVFHSTSEKQRTEVDAALKAAGEGGALDVKVNMTLEQALETTSATTIVRQVIFGFTSLPFPERKDIIEFARTFNTKTPNAPVIMNYETTGYESVPGMAPAAFFDPVVETRRLYTSKVAPRQAQLIAAKNAITALQRVYDAYGFTGDKTLAEREKTIDADIATLETLKNQMASDPTKRYELKDFVSLTWGEPTLNVELHRVGAFGGTGGGPWSEHVTEAYVAKSAVLTELTVYGDHWVDRMKMKYEGMPELTEGGPGQQRGNTLTLQKRERVTSVNGEAGQYVNCLTIKTNFNNTLGPWPDTHDRAATFSWPGAEKDYVFVGFDGRSGKFVDQISIITAKFGEAIWKPYIAPPRLAAPERSHVVPDESKREPRTEG